MTVEEMKKVKQEKGYTYAQIAELTGVPLGTVQKIFNGETENPRYTTIQALEKLFVEAVPPVVRESAAAYRADRRPGMYTVEDYRALPEDQRVELIDGYFSDMAAPNTSHQRIVGEIYRQIANYIMDKDGGCTPFTSPVDVQLDQDRKTMLQPDVVIVCNPDQIVKSNIIGAPDFVLEVVSPGSTRKDYVTKLYKYEKAKVREYWLVDPCHKRVMVYFFETEACPKIYPINADIPVNIYEGKLVINFQHIAVWASKA